MYEEFGIAELTTKLSGAILRKAEMENDFDKVYSKVFEKMVEVEFFGGDDFLSILGNVGG